MGAFFNHENYIPEIWFPRIDKLASYINKLGYITHVYDFGCGPCSLKSKLLDKNYVGFDITQVDDTVHKINFNLDVFPNICNGDIKERLAVCSGILEYIKNIECFILNLSINFDTVIYTYGNEKLCKQYNVSTTAKNHVYNIRRLFSSYYPKVLRLESVFNNTTDIYFCKK